MYYFVLRGICLSTFSHDAVRILASPESTARGRALCKMGESLVAHRIVKRENSYHQWLSLWKSASGHNLFSLLQKVFFCFMFLFFFSPWKTSVLQLEMLLIPNALCWSSRKCNCTCALPRRSAIALARYPQKLAKIVCG